MALMLVKDVPLRTRRALSLSYGDGALLVKDVPLRTRRALSLSMAMAPFWSKMFR